jgi:hypothetical protein
MMRPDAIWLIVSLTSIPIGVSAGGRNGEKSSPGALIHDHSYIRLQGLQVGWLVGWWWLVGWLVVVVGLWHVHGTR